MDEILAKYKTEVFDDSLDVCYEIGIVWQRDRTKTINYEEKYWEKYVSYEHTPIGIKLNKFRCKLVEKYCSSILDVGIGCGEFIKKLRIPAIGYDINPVAVKWLTERNLFFDPYAEPIQTKGVTLWDVIEHLPYPKKLLDRIPKDCYVFVSLPTINNFYKLYESKHYRPGEHLTYFSTQGILYYFNLNGFEFLEARQDESHLGREKIETFVFVKSASN